MLLMQELKEIRQDMKRFRAGKLKPEDAMVLIGFYSQSHKRANSIVQLLSMARKFGNSSLNKAVKMGLIGDGSCIDLSPEELEEEKVVCSLKGRTITRHECLDYSGSKEHFENCKDCDTGAENKRCLVPDALHVA